MGRLAKIASLRDMRNREMCEWGTLGTQMSPVARRMAIRGKPRMERLSRAWEARFGSIPSAPIVAGEEETMADVYRCEGPLWRDGDGSPQVVVGTITQDEDRWVGEITLEGLFPQRAALQRQMTGGCTPKASRFSASGLPRGVAASFLSREFSTGKSGVRGNPGRVDLGGCPPKCRVRR